MVVGLVLLTSLNSFADEVDDEQAIRAVIGEASNQGYDGLLAVCVAIRNRGHLKGVYGLKAKHVDKEPEWVWAMARKAWKESKHNRFHSGTHWENIKAFGTPYWVKDMAVVCKIGCHTFYAKKKK